MHLGIFSSGPAYRWRRITNNHHTYPNSAKLSRKAYEFDIGWFWIKLFCFMGMASVYAETGGSEKSKSLDSDNVWALLMTDSMLWLLIQKK